MEVQAILRSLRISTRKVRLIADVIRGKKVLDAMNTLALIHKRAAIPVGKTLKSAITNATNNAKLKAEDLVISAIEVGEGTALKRYHPSTRGRIHPYKKRSSHIRIVLKSKEKKEKGDKV